MVMLEIEEIAEVLVRNIIHHALARNIVEERLQKAIAELLVNDVISKAKMNKQEHCISCRVQCVVDTVIYQAMAMCLVEHVLNRNSRVTSAGHFSCRKSDT